MPPAEVEEVIGYAKDSGCVEGEEGAKVGG